MFRISCLMAYEISIAAAPRCCHELTGIITAHHLLDGDTALECLNDAMVELDVEPGPCVHQLDVRA